MPEAIVVLGAVASGAFCSGAVLAIAPRPDRLDAASWLARRRAVSPASDQEPFVGWTRLLEATGGRDWLADQIVRAGWHETPERVVAFAAALSSCLTVLGVSSAPVVPVYSAAVLGLFGAVSGFAMCAVVLRSSIARRRRRLEGEFAPLLELFTLELSGGGSALTALGSVCTQVQGELAADLRRLLIASHLAGSDSFESRLLDYSEQLEIPAVGSLATILGASREHGTGVVHGVRALAIDLRRAQRRELIAHSRRALNHVLLPAAVGVLLPFLAILLFPAITALRSNLR
jgi:Flp pilus assembly protein TadB